MKKPAKRAHVKPHKRPAKKATPARKKTSVHPTKHPKKATRSKAAAAKPKRKLGKAKASALLVSGEAYTPDTIDPRDHIYHPTTLEPTFVDLSPQMPPIWDQGGDEDCVAYAALAVALHASPDADPVLPDTTTGEIREAVRACATTLGLEYLRVRVEDVPACLNDGLPIVFGVTLIDGDRTLGPHAMVAVGYDSGFVKVRNSWGEDHHNDGHMLMPLAHLEQHGADYWTIR